MPKLGAPLDICSQLLTEKSTFVNVSGKMRYKVHPELNFRSSKICELKLLVRWLVGCRQVHWDSDRVGIILTRAHTYSKFGLHHDVITYSTVFPIA